MPAATVKRRFLQGPETGANFLVDTDIEYAVQPGRVGRDGPPAGIALALMMQAAGLLRHRAFSFTFVIAPVGEILPECISRFRSISAWQIARAG